MTKIVPWMLGLVALAGLSPIAHAGLKSRRAVVIDETYREAKGSLGSARNSADGKEFIGCTVWGRAGGHTTVECHARDARNQVARCTSTDPAIVQAAQALTSDSSIMFRWDDMGNCERLLVHVYSDSEPKAP